MTEEITKGEWEALSAYLDGQLARREIARLEKMLRARPELRLALADLRRTGLILRSQPAIRAPRRFMLTPEMVGAGRAKRLLSGFFQSMRLASALASALFVLVVFGEVFFNSRLSAALPLAAETQAIAELAQAVQEAAVEAPPTPAPEVQDMVLTVEVEKAVEPAFGATPTPEAIAADSAATEAGLAMEMPPSAEANARSSYPPPEAPPVESIQQDSVAGAAPTAQPEEPPSEENAEALQLEAAQDLQSAEARPGFWTIWRYLEIGLVILGLGTGLAAYHLRRTGRA